MPNQDQLDKIASGRGFIAALDQSGGSSPKALTAYGHDPADWDGDDAMFDLIHAMRTRIMTSKAFGGDRVLGAILFEDTMDRQVEGVDTPTYLWETKGVVPFLKTDKGLADEQHGAQVMKPFPELDALLERAVAKGVFGTKMRSVVHGADRAGIDAVLDQQFEVGRQIAAAGLVPILEPEVNIHSESKAAAEDLLLEGLMARLDELEDQTVMLKLTLPETAGHYRPAIEHERVLSVVALSGGYSKAESCQRLAQNHGMIASFSRALTQDLRIQQTDDEFDAVLDETIQEIFDASIA